MSSEFDQMVDKVINYSLEIKQNEKVLIVADTENLHLAEGLAAEVKKAGGELNLYFIPEELRPVLKMSKLLKRAIEFTDVLIYAITEPAVEKPFRVQLFNLGADHGRVCALTGVGEEALIRGMNVDMHELNEFTMNVKDYLMDKDKITIRDQKGNELSLRIKGQRIIEKLAKINEKWDHSTLPVGQVFFTPLSASLNGEISVDSCGRNLGKAKLSFRDNVAQIEGESAKEIIDVIKDNPDAKHIGIIGFGTNPNAQLGPSFIENEKIRGSIHLGLGYSWHLSDVMTNYYFSFIVEKPDVIVDGKYLIKNGEYLFE